MEQEQEYQEEPETFGVVENIYDKQNNTQGDNLRYRLDAKDSIQELCNFFRGLTYDKFGKPVLVKTEKGVPAVSPIVNEEGIYNIQAWLQSSCGKITHLTKYQNEDRVLRQMKNLSRAWLFLIVLNRKRWGIENKDLVIHAGEKLLFESMLRASEGFENNNISQTYIVRENINRDARPPEQVGRRGFLSRFLGG